MWLFCLYEVKYKIRSVIPYLFIAILAGVAMHRIQFNLKIAERYLLLAPEYVNPLNGPAILSVLVSSFSVYLLFMLAIFMYQTFYRYIHKKFYNLLLALPIKKYQYFLGVLGGNVAVLSGVFVVVIIIYRAVLCFPFIPAEIVMKDNMLHYIIPTFINVIPNMLIWGAFFISAFLLSKRLASIFVVCFIYIILAYLSGLFGKQDNGEMWALLLDPSGLQAVRTELISLGITAKEMNAHVVGLSFYSILNRVVWLVVSLGGLYLSMKWRRFDYGFVVRKGK